MSNKITYADSGVNIKEGYLAVEKMKQHVKSTFNDNVLTDIGSFGGLFRLPINGMAEPVLVSGTDGVGTKLKIAFMADKHDTVGQDLVAMCVNDVLCQGAQPLFFLDYLATGKLNATQAADIVKGVAAACRLSGCALIGGETAEMPGFYSAGEYDMAGFTVGLVDRPNIIDGQNIKAGDIAIGIASSGFHSNGYSLIRKLIFDVAKLSLDETYPSTNKTVKDVLLTPTALYVKPVLELLKQVTVKGAAHITGGGFIENIPRTLPQNLAVKIKRDAWQVPSIFRTLQSLGNLSNQDMFNTFNMGIGFVVIVAAEDVQQTLAILNSDMPAYQIGEVVVADQGVIL